MSHHKKFNFSPFTISFSCVLIISQACSPTPRLLSEAEMKTAVAETVQALPTFTQPPTASPTHTFVPTETFIPTSTPSMTPSPSSTPRPSRTPSSTPRPSPTTNPVDLYKLGISIVLLDCANHIDTFGDKNGEMQDDPFLLLDIPFRIELEEILLSLEICAGQFQESRRVPDGWEEVDLNIVRAGEELQAMVDDYRVGLENFDDVKILQAVVHMNMVTEFISRASDAFP